MSKLAMHFLIYAMLAATSALAQDRSALEFELDKFAAEHFDKIQTRSFSEGVEYCGLFGYDAQGNLRATEPKRGRVDSCQPDDPPYEFDVIASYHTHGAFSPDADSEVPSYDDLMADIEEGIDGYIATPGGRLWLNIVEDEMAYQLCGPGCVPADKDFQKCPKLPPVMAYDLDSLEAREYQDNDGC